MGMSPVGKLIYGYALGGTVDGPLIAEINEDGEWQTPWAVALATDPKREHEDPDPFDHIEKILRDAGVDIGDEYDDNKILRLINHGHLEYGHCSALVTYVASTEWSQATPVILAELDARREAENWDQLLAQAIGILGITPVAIDGKNWDLETSRVPVPPRWMVVAEYI